jgi:hypothetical protein
MVVKIVQSKLKLKPLDNFSKIPQCETSVHRHKCIGRCGPEVLEIGGDFQMIFPIAGYIAIFFADFLSSWNAQTYSYTDFFRAKQYASL